MDNKEVCSKVGNIYWVSEERSFLIVGRGKMNSEYMLDCAIVVGASTDQPSVLQLKFDAVYIEDCGVTISINQSSVSDFTDNNTEMLKLKCNQGQVKMLHAKEKHYVKISVHRANENLARYNFRINVSLAEAPSNVGLEKHVVIIVGVVVVLVVCALLYVLVRYLLHLVRKSHERRAQQNMERAIHLYNSQESQPESDYMYTALPHADFTHSRGQHNNHHNGVRTAGPRPGRHHSGDITFVHANGHMETFRIQNTPSARVSRGALDAKNSVVKRGASSHQTEGATILSENGHIAEDFGECPPSYEEALRMPAARDTLAVYVNIEEKPSDRDT
ncbi:hypothetical protein C0Q70_15106 [Pomacea canaliculata]|uniref:Uncharacterized protein n=2 Tax=Pomacea canaliculata TaxID=400727 RepID=A0A2T7NTY0_POMCA|nr:hypothetical protein C0Q70_15106 [Pomacea canaliculata]